VLRAFRRRVAGAVYRALRRAGRPFLPRSLDAVPRDRPLHLAVPTFDGSGQAVHPDLLDLGGEGGACAMAFTPYPWGDDRLENPSVVVSPDGLRFREERPGLNPLAPAPPHDHNDDPDLFRDGEGYGLLYLETLRPEVQNLVLLRSRDRLRWERTLLHAYRLAGPDPEPFIVSPAFLRRDGRSHLFYVNASASPRRIEVMAGADPGSWDPACAEPVRMARMAFEPWHLDVLGGEAWCYMIIADVTERSPGRRVHDLHLARSRDLRAWEVSPRRLFDRAPFGAAHLYRSSGLLRGGDLFLYFSYRSKRFGWRLGLVRRRLADFFPPDGARGGGRA
jgi:hypothetical protein